MIDLKFQYKPLFIIKLAHTYFGDRPAEGFQIVPTRRTFQLIESMGMLLRRKEGELHILCDVSRTDMLYQRLVQAGNSESKFSFLLFTSNPCFTNITDIPTDRKGRTFYFSNKHKGVENNISLHQNEFVGAEDLYSTEPQVLEQTGVNTDYKIALENGDAEVDMPIVDIEQGFQIDTGRLLEGHYKVFGNDSELSSFINIGERIKGTPLGFIDLFFHSQLKQKILAELESDDLSSYLYHISFDARSVFWKFMVFPTYLKRVKKLNINCKKGNLAFKQLGKEKIKDKNAVAFISEKPVKFSKYYSYEIQLEKLEGENAKKVLIKKLSYAPFDILKPGDENYYMSEIYVYV